MGKKRSRQKSSNHIGESSESGDGLDVSDKTNGVKTSCSHIKKSVEVNAVLKNFNSDTFGKKPCAICEKEEKGVVKVTEETWVCLKCGHKTCSKKHSLEHFKVPRSDPHCVCVKMPDYTAWCHSCDADIPLECNKRLKDCVVTLKRVSEKSESKHQSKTSQMGVIVEEKADGSSPAVSSPQKQLPKTPIKCHLPPSVKGLSNLGNTCFFNSVLQCLAQTPHLVSVLKEMETSQPISLQLRNEVVEGTLDPCEGTNVSLRSTLEALSCGGATFSPKQLLELLRKKYTLFWGYEQHDAHELLRHLLELVRSEDLKRYRLILLKKMGLAAKASRQNVSEEVTKKLKALNHEVCSIVDLVPEQVFKGLLVSEIVCKDCFNSSEQIETFLDLSLPIMSEKPQPPCVRRRGGSSASSSEDKAGRVSKFHTNKKGRRVMKMNYAKSQGPNQEKSQSSPQEANASEVSEKGFGSDIEGDIEDNEETDKRHESGYSSEKVSSSLRESPMGSCEGSGGDSARASPASIVEALAHLELAQEEGVDSDSSTKALINSPIPLCDGDNTCLCAGLPPSGQVPFWPQYRISLGRHCEEEVTMPSYRSIGCQTLPLTQEKVPDFSQMLFRDPALPDTTVIVRDSRAIMKSDPDWALRLPLSCDLSQSKKCSGGLSDIEDVPEELPPLYSEVSFPPSYEEATSPDTAMVPLNLPVGPIPLPPPLVPSLLDEPPPPKLAIDLEEDEEEGPMIGSLYDDDPPLEGKSPLRRSPELSEANDEPYDEANAGDETRERQRHCEEGECSVQSCLSQFTSIELMAGNNKVGCSNCTANKGNKDGKTVLTISTKRFLIAKTPPVLILHLKRFQVQMYSFRKLTKHVCFPLELDVAPYCSKKALDECSRLGLGLMYRLYGVVEHKGTLNSGHYVAYVNVEKEGDNRWFYISDSHVNEVTESRVLSSQAYLLFYKRIPLSE